MKIVGKDVKMADLDKNGKHIRISFTPEEEKAFWCYWRLSVFLFKT